jgi:hypothetical protein
MKDIGIRPDPASTISASARRITVPPTGRLVSYALGNLGVPCAFSGGVITGALVPTSRFPQCGFQSAEVEFMKKVQLVLLAAGALLLASCAQSTTAPSQMRTNNNGAKPRFDDFSCPSGYTVAYDDNGNPYCIPSGNESSSSTRRP